jgi:hypothetical protein
VTSGQLTPTVRLADIITTTSNYVYVVLSYASRTVVVDSVADAEGRFKSAHACERGEAPPCVEHGADCSGLEAPLNWRVCS